MQIRKLRTNHIENPVGFAMDTVTLSYLVCDTAGARQKSARIRVAADEGMQNIRYDSGMSTEIDSIAYVLPMQTEPKTRYYWNVEAVADNGDTAVSGTAYFETPPDLDDIRAEMITAEEPLDVAEFYKRIAVEGTVASARAYVSAQGVYELRVDGHKAGDEYLTPYCNDYESWQQVITCDVTGMLAAGEHEVSIVVAPGWYSGYFGFDGRNHIYGDEKAALLQLEITYTDGSRACIVTDESWQVRACEVRYAEIYHGEVFDAAFSSDAAYPSKIAAFDRERLQARRSLPVRVMETVRPKRILHTPAGETLIDMGQNMVGWLAFTCREKAGARVYLQYGEVTQQGNFYRDNLRSAKAEFTYISDGKERVVRPHLTFYGFRYVKIEGIEGELSLEDFAGEVIYSRMDVTGSIETSNPLVNRLALNALWGQKGNFVDMPTDCPQRDERMGWTGDAQVFSGTALFNMDVQAFYAKYGYDMLMEQRKYDGCVPMVIPSFGMGPGGSAAWADAATVIPWNTYVYTGDKAILEQQYPSMKLWADYIHRKDAESGGRGLWQTGFHFGDWLALDGNDPTIPTGATEQFYVASAYYYLSTLLTGKAARVLGKDADAAHYEELAKKIAQAIRDEYFTKNGRLAIATQTGYILALAFGFCPKEYEERVAADLNAKIAKDGGKLMTGFVGTPYICQVLSGFGYNETAYRLLLNDECPSWLYPVRMGATTIWERWDSIRPDGSISPEGMNSLNHYSYGAIAEWMYRYMGGINPMEEAPGFREIRLSPMPDYRMSRARVTFDSPVGTYVSAWEIAKERLSFHFEIPFGGRAYVTLPDASADAVCRKDKKMNGVQQCGSKVRFVLDAGSYDISYVPTASYCRSYSTEMELKDVLAHEKIRERIFEAVPALSHFPVEMHGGTKIAAMAYDQMIPVSAEDVERIAGILKEYVIEPDRIPEMIMDI